MAFNRKCAEAAMPIAAPRTSAGNISAETIQGTGATPAW